MLHTSPSEPFAVVMEDAVRPIQDLLSPLLVMMCLAFMCVKSLKLAVVTHSVLRLYGIFTTQCYSYWFKNDEDSHFEKAFVTALWYLSLSIESIPATKQDTGLSKLYIRGSASTFSTGIL